MKKITNREIYTYANNLLVEFSNNKDLKLPIKLNFYLQKNMQALIALASEIETNRLEIIKQYGTLNEDTSSYTIPNDKIDEVNKQLNELFDIEQEVQIYTVNINALSNDLNFTMKQMEALIFMIEQ